MSLSKTLEGKINSKEITGNLVKLRFRVVANQISKTSRHREIPSTTFKHLATRSEY